MLKNGPEFAISRVNPKTMSIRTVISAIALLVSPFISHSEAISLDKALNSKMISIECKGIDTMAHYGKCLSVSITNNHSQSLEVEIERGMVFLASPTSYQNFIVTRPEIVALGPGQRISTAVNAMCIESSDMGPGGETDFYFQGRTDDTMGILLAYLDENNLMNPLGQEAVWTLTERYPLEPFWATDSMAAGNLFNFMESKFNLPETWDDYTGVESAPEPVYREMRIGGMVEYYSSKEGDDVYIALFNTNGVLERELYHNPDFPSGKVKVDYEFNAAEFTASAYLIRLTIDGVIKYERKVDLSMLPDRE